VMVRSVPLLAAALALLCSTASAAQSGTADLNTPAYHIVTDAAHTNLNTGDFEMPHKVHLTRPGTDAVADSAHGNSKLGTASLVGNVVVHDSGNAPEAGAQNGYNGSGPATLLCDQLEIDAKAKLYTATGHVHFTQGTRSGTADRAVLNRGSGMLHLEGSVHLSDNGSTLSGDSVDYNLNTKDAQVHGSPAVMSQPANQPPQPARSQSPKPQAPKTKPPKTQPKPTATPTRRP
jgi:lipopolysaccharide assembly outer membrane protein LptD (OstA)